MAASETLPDVMYHLPGTIFDLADKGLVLDLTSYVDDELKMICTLRCCRRANMTASST